MKKKLVVAILCATMILSLTACGDSTGNADGGNAGTQSESSQITNKEEKETDSEEKAVMKSAITTSYVPATGDPVSQMKLEYDENGCKTYEKQISYNQGEEVSVEYQYNWKKDGNTETADTGNGMVVTITYDDAGEKVEEIKETEMMKTVLTYKDGVLATQKVTSTMHGDVYSVTETTFDEYGNPLKSTVSHPTTDTTYTVEYSNEYDEDGKLVSATITNSEDGAGQECTFEYVCDDNGNITEVYTYMDGMLSSYVVYEYYQ